MGIFGKLFNALIEVIFGPNPADTIKSGAGTAFMAVGLLGMAILGVWTYIHFIKAKRFDKQFWLLLTGAIIGGILAYGGWGILQSISDTVSNNL